VVRILTVALAVDFKSTVRTVTGMVSQSDTGTQRQGFRFATGALPRMGLGIVGREATRAQSTATQPGGSSREIV
jgi:hypothetical protein